MATLAIINTTVMPMAPPVLKERRRQKEMATAMEAASWRISARAVMTSTLPPSSHALSEYVAQGRAGATVDANTQKSQRTPEFSGGGGGAPSVGGEGGGMGGGVSWLTA